MPLSGKLVKSMTTWRSEVTKWRNEMRNRCAETRKGGREVTNYCGPTRNHFIGRTGQVTAPAVFIGRMDHGAFSSMVYTGTQTPRRFTRERLNSQSSSP